MLNYNWVTSGGVLHGAAVYQSLCPLAKAPLPGLAGD
jgi:hypothetical protein